MDKPFSVMCEDFKKELADLINNSSLPPFVVESILQNYLIEINSIVKRQYQIDKAKYDKFILNKDKKEKNENNEKDSIFEEVVDAV